MSSKRERKLVLMKKTYELVTKHTQVVMVSLSNVGSSQVQKIRRALAEKGATLLIGKNTIIKKAMLMRAQKLADQKNIPEKAFFEQVGGESMPQLNALINETKGKLGLIFSDLAAFELKTIISSNRVKCAAKVGMVAQCDVFVPSGSTGLDPSQISFFHALQVSTKINKGQIEIVKDFQVCKKDEFVTNSASVFLKKMNITPFEYGMEMVGVYSEGVILSAEMVNMTPELVLQKFSSSVSNIAAMSLQLNIPTLASIPHSIANGFKNVCGISIEQKFDITAMAQLQASSAVAAPVQVAKVEAKVEEPEEEEEEDVDMGDLFGDF